MKTSVHWTSLFLMMLLAGCSPRYGDLLFASGVRVPLRAPVVKEDINCPLQFVVGETQLIGQFEATAQGATLVLFSPLGTRWFVVHGTAEGVMVEQALPLPLPLPIEELFFASEMVLLGAEKVRSLLPVGLSIEQAGEALVVRSDNQLLVRCEAERDGRDKVLFSDLAEPRLVEVRTATECVVDSRER